MNASVNAAHNAHSGGPSSTAYRGAKSTCLVALTSRLAIGTYKAMAAIVAAQDQTLRLRCFRGSRSVLGAIVFDAERAPSQMLEARAA